MKEIPKDILPFYKLLSSELSWINVRWNYYKQLYRSSPERIELLNAASSSFFSHFRNILIDDIILAICRITDPPESCGKQNMTLSRLIDAVRQSGRESLISKATTLASEILDRVKPFREHRKKRIAHTDYSLVFQSDDCALPGISVPMIEELLQKIADLLNEIELHYTGGTMIYDMVIVPENADVLVQKLKAGLFFEEMLREEPLEWLMKFRASRWFKA